jgi:hypothetical protein
MDSGPGSAINLRTSGFLTRKGETGQKGGSVKKKPYLSNQSLASVTEAMG